MFYEEEQINGEWFFRTTPDGPLYNNYKKNEEEKLKRKKEQQRKAGQEYHKRTYIKKKVQDMDIKRKYPLCGLDRLFHKIMEKTGEEKSTIIANVGLESGRVSKIRAGVLKISPRMILQIHELYDVPVAEIREIAGIPRDY